MFKFCLSAFVMTRMFYLLIICLTYVYLRKWELPSEVINSSYYNIEDSSILQGLFNCLTSFLKHFYAYDSVHFIHIAEKGYSTDLNYVFFPLFPLLIKYCRIILFLPDETYSYIFSGLLISNSLCFMNTLVLYKLTYFFSKAHSKARVACFLFLINPGTIFFISVYSENLYFLITQLFILFVVVRQYDKRTFAFIFFVVITMTVRSTSIFLAVYFCIPIITQILAKVSYEQNTTQNLKKIYSAVYSKVGLVTKLVSLGVIFCGLFFYMTSIRPRSDICYSVYKKMQLGNVGNISNIGNMVHNSSATNSDVIDKTHSKLDLFSQTDLSIIQEYSTLCREAGFTYNFYSHIQKKYWDVSFLSQYRLDKLDRIILSIPMNILGLLVILSFINKFNFRFLTNLQIDKFILDDRENAGYKQTNLDPRLDLDNLTIYKSFLFSSYLNFIVNFLVVTLIAHPQINNRVYATCPVIYLFSADEVINFSLNKKLNYKGLYVILFFFLFSILGCIMQVGSYGFA